MDLGYARVSTAKQDLDRQLDALTSASIPLERIYQDKKSGATTDRPGLRTALEYARAGDVIVVHTLDRLGRTVRDTLNLIHDLAERGVGVRNLADPIKVDSANPGDPMAQLAVVLLALFAQMERTYTVERAAHARSVATAKGRRVGRPVVVDPDKLAYAGHLRDAGHTVADITAKTGITAPASTGTCHPNPATPTPPRRRPHPLISPPPPPPRDRSGLRGQLTRTPASSRTSPGRSATNLLAPDVKPTTGLQERNSRIHGQPVVRAVALPCGCAVDEHAAALQHAQTLRS